MATTLGFCKLNPVHGGFAPRLAYGTVASIGDGGSFSITLESAGSAVLRNVQSVFLTPIGTAIGGGSVVVAGWGSSDGYVFVHATQLGSFSVPVLAGTLDLNFAVIGGGGSI